MAVVDVLKPRLLLWSALACLIALTACSKAVVRQRPPAPLTDAWGLAVYPVTFLFPVTPYESFVRGRSVADDLSQHTDLSVFGPGEFRVLNPDDDDLRKATTIASVARFSPERQPTGMYGVRIIVNRLVTKGEAATLTNKSGQAQGQRSADQATDVSVRVELLSMGSRSVIAEIEGHTAVDGLRDVSTLDRFPEITALTRSLIDSLLDVARFRPARRNLNAGLRTVPVLAPALTFSMPGAVTLQNELAKFDALDREAQLLILVKRSDPQAPRSRQRVIQSAPEGLVVAESKEAALKAGLEPDDLIVSVNDEPILGRYVLDRHLRVGAARLVVRRSGAEREVTLSLDAK